MVWWDEDIARETAWKEARDRAQQAHWAWLEALKQCCVKLLQQKLASQEPWVLPAALNQASA